MIRPSRNVKSTHSLIAILSALNVVSQDYTATDSSTVTPITKKEHQVGKKFLWQTKEVALSAKLSAEASIQNIAYSVLQWQV